MDVRVMRACIICACERWQAFKGTASSFDDLEFGISSSAEVAAALGAKVPSVVVFKTFDEGRADFEVSGRRLCGDEDMTWRCVSE